MSNLDDAALAEGEEYAEAAEPAARLLGLVYRVKNLDHSIQFYEECLGMEVFKKHDNTLEKYKSAVVGYGLQITHFSLELRHYHDIQEFNVGTGFGHIGINVLDVRKSLELIKAKGGKVIKDALQPKGSSTMCAFVEDPNGYEVELLQRPFFGDPLCQVMLRVLNLDQAIDFYKKAFEMKMLRTFELDILGAKFRLAFLGFGPEDRTTVLELNSIFGVTEHDKGNAYLELIVGVKDILKTCKQIQDAGGKISQRHGTIAFDANGEVAQGNATLMFDALDVEGWKMVLLKDSTTRELPNLSL